MRPLSTSKPVSAAACWACGGATGPCAYLAPLPFVECRSCGLAFQPDAGEVAAIYEDPSGYEAERLELYAGEGFEHLRRAGRVRVRYLERFAQPGRVLDVGTAGGAFLVEARAAGWDPAGVEPMPAAAAFARDHGGLDVRTGIVEDIELPSSAYDAVTMWHVLEHVPHPLGTLERLRGALKPGGRLAVEVPNGGSVIARREGPSWRPAEPDVHVSQFTPTALRRLLERAGFRVEDVETVSGLAYYEWHQRLDPRTLVHVARIAWWARTPRQRHPAALENLRAVATSPA